MSKAISIVIVVLMSLLAHGDCGLLRERRHVNHELIKTLEQLTKGEVACGDTMVADIVFDRHAATGSFCKAAKVLQRVPLCNAIQQQLNKLIVNLQMAAEETSNCSFDEHSQVEMKSFLKNLETFCKHFYRLQ